jgi:hypothetical protein
VSANKINYSIYKLIDALTAWLVEGTGDADLMSLCISKASLLATAKH